MAGEAEYAYADEVVVSSATSIAAGAVSGTASVQTILSSSNHSNYPIGDAILAITGSGSISSASATINLYRRDMNLSTGTVDSPVLSTATNEYYMQQYVGSFIAKHDTATASEQSMQIAGVPLSEECEFYIESKFVNAIATWSLKVRPKTFVPGS